MEALYQIRFCVDIRAFLDSVGSLSRTDGYFPKVDLDTILGPCRKMIQVDKHQKLYSVFYANSEASENRSGSTSPFSPCRKSQAAGRNLQGLISAITTKSCAPFWRVGSANMASFPIFDEVARGPFLVTSCLTSSRRWKARVCF